MKLKLFIKTKEETSNMDKDDIEKCLNNKVDWDAFKWIIGIALTLSLSAIAASANNQNRLEKRIDEHQTSMTQLQKDMSTLLERTEWLQKMKDSGQITIKK